MLLLQEFDIIIKDRQGKENLVANFQSGVPKTNDLSAMDDQFPHEHLFVMVVKAPWYADVENYLVVGKLPRHLSTKEWKLIVQHSAQFSWIGGYLFHTWSDMQIR